MIDKLKEFVEGQMKNLTEQKGKTEEFTLKLSGALEFTSNVLVPFIEELEKSESDSVSKESNEAE